MKKLIILLVFAVACLGQNPNSSVFPNGIASDANLLVASNNAISTLTASLNNSATTFTLATSTNFIAPTALTIENEIVICQSLSGATYSSCARGQSGTAAVSHSQGVLVYENIIAYFHNQTAAEIKAIETALGNNFNGGGVAYKTANYNPVAADNSTLIVSNGSGLTDTLPASPPSSKWKIALLNLNSSALTISPNGLTINGGSSSITISQGQSTTIWTDGSNYFSAAGAGGGGGGSSANCAAATGSGTASVTLTISPTLPCNLITMPASGLVTVTFPTPGAATSSGFSLIFANSSDSTNPNLAATGATVSAFPTCIAASGHVTTMNYTWDNATTTWVLGSVLDSNGTVLTTGQIPAASACGSPAAANQTNISTIGYAAGGGSANAQTVTLSPAVTALTNGLSVCWLPTAANTTTTPTLAVNGLTATTLVKAGGALAANDLITTAIACARYDGTYFELQNPQTVSGGGGSSIITQDLPYGGCTTGAGYPNWWSAPAANCLTGGTVAIGEYQIGSGAGPIGVAHTIVPYGWTSGEVDLTLDLSNSNTGSAASITVATYCAPSGSSINTFSFNAAQTISFTPLAFGLMQYPTQTSLTMTGCSAGNLMMINVARTDSNGQTIYFIGAHLKFNIP